jgi:uncharacterized protein (TIGR02466 family)
MIFLKDIPIVSSGIFIYQLNLNTDYSKYYTNLDYEDCDTGYDLSLISKNMSVINELEDLKNEINSSCKHFIKSILNMDSDFSIYNSWFTKTKQYGYSSSHTHTNSWLSGCFYPEQNKDFNIKFYNDNSNVFFTAPNNINIYNARDWVVNPQKNQLILFFSNLRHEICQNKSVQDRYSLAFNVLPNGNFGVGDSKVNFKL